MSISPESQKSDSIFDSLHYDTEATVDGDTSTTTPITDLSPPRSPPYKNAALTDARDSRARSLSLAASLTLEEQVWRLNL